MIVTKNYLKKIIKEELQAISETDGNSNFFTPEELEMIGSELSTLMQEGLYDDIKKKAKQIAAKYGVPLAAAISLFSGGNAQAQQWKKDLGKENEPTWQQIVGVTKRPEDTQRPEEKKFKYAVATIKKVSNGEKVATLSFEINGRDLNRFGMEIEALLLKKHPPGTFTVDVVGSDTEVPDSVSSDVSKPSGKTVERAPEIQYSSDGKSVKSVKIYGGSGGDAASKATDALIKKGVRNIKTGEVTQNSDGSWNVPIVTK